MRTGLHRRLRTVEVKVEQLTKDVAETRIMAAENDEDLAPFRQEMRAHNRVLNALRDTQIEQGKTLDDHGKILARLTATVDRHSAKLDEHSATLDEHTVKLDEHSAKLDEHSAKLDEHSAKLDEHSAKLDEHTVKLDTLVAGQGAIMKHLGIAPSDGERSRQ